MGLDSATIVYEIENCFAIQISDKDAERIKNVGELCDYVSNKLSSKDQKKCLNQILFFRLRKFFTQQLPIKSSTFKASLKISHIADRKTLTVLWPKLRKELALIIPELRSAFSRNQDELFTTETVQELVDKIIQLNIVQLELEQGLSRSTVSGIVKGIIHETTGINRKLMTRDAKFRDDLGIN